MKVKMTQLRATPNGVYQPDQVVDVSDADARHLIGHNYAVAVDPLPPGFAPIVRETATLPPPPETGDANKPRKP